MSGLGLLLRKELLEQTRTMRMVVLACVFALFGIVSPLTAKYLPDILKAVAADQFPVGLIPTPKTADALDQIIKNLDQFGILAAILLAMGAVATEKDRGTAAFILTKPASRAAFLVAKLVAISVDLLVATVVGCVLGYVYTAILFEPLPAGGFAAMTVLIWVSLVVYAALTLLGSTLARSAAVGAGLGFLFLIVTGLIAALPNVGKWMPQGLLGPARGLALGQAGAANDLWGPLAVSLVFIVGCLVLSWLAFRRQEL